MTIFDTAPKDDDIHIYRNVQSYQVLQRGDMTDEAWVQQKDKKYRRLQFGGPYTIDDAHHVMVGDIWILAGQSNMRGYGFFDHGDDNNNSNDGCHVFQSNESWGFVRSNQPVHQLSTSPRFVHHTLPDPTVREPAIVNDRGASLVPAFVQRYQQALDIPVGVVPCAHGGVTIQQWMKHEDDGSSNHANTTLYGAMMDKIRLVGGRYTGILWYQGESDAVHYDTAKYYATDFTRWYQQFQKDVLKVHGLDYRYFVFAQIGRMVNSSNSNKRSSNNNKRSNNSNKRKLDDDDDDNNNNLAWSMVRKAQLDLCTQQQSPQHFDDSFLGQPLPVPGFVKVLVSTLDADMDDHIHLSASGLHTIGERMAEAVSTVMLHDLAPEDAAATLQIYASQVTMVHVPFGNNHWRHLLRLNLLDPASSYTWRRQQHDNNITGFTIHDMHTDGCPVVDMIYSVRINAQQQVDLYITENGYQQLVTATKAAATDDTQRKPRYMLWYGYGQNPQCNLVTTTNAAALAFGPLPIHVTSLPDSGGQLD